ncbi:MAG: hypothetical protein RL839_04355 [Gammaproteobacteria bacterium]
MAKITIDNQVEDSWQETIEQSANLVLSSLGPSISSIRIEFVELPANKERGKRFRCRVLSPGLGHGFDQVAVEHPNGFTAIDGALQRFRRIVNHIRQIGRLDQQQGYLRT